MGISSSLEQGCGNPEIWVFCPRRQKTALARASGSRFSTCFFRKTGWITALDGWVCTPLFLIHGSRIRSRLHCGGVSAVIALPGYKMAVRVLQVF